MIRNYKRKHNLAPWCVWMFLKIRHIKIIFYIIIMGMNTWCNANSVSFKSHSIQAGWDEARWAKWLSKFVQCWVPRESVLRDSGTHKATSTAQNYKVTLIEWHLKLTLLALNQVFTPVILILPSFLIKKFRVENK